MIKKSFLLLALIISTQIIAQRSSSSPYSFFGMGDEFNPRTVEQNSMGGLGATLSNSYQLNLLNPAAIADLKFSTYVFGLYNNNLRVKDQTTSQSSNASGLNYFGFGTHIGTKVGITFGLQPVSSVGYSLRNGVTDINGDLTEFNLFEGDGGLNRIYAGLGYKILKDLSIGVEADFIFGKTENSVLNQRADVFLATKNKETVNIRGGKIKLGAIYNKNIKDDLNLRLGATVELPHNLDAKGEEHLYSLTLGVTGVEIPRDTIYSGNVEGKFKNPINTIVGIGLGKDNKWFAGVDYKVKQAIETSGYLEEASNTFRYENSNRLSVGGYFIPKFNSINSYWDRVTYRAGVRMEKIGLQVNGTDNPNNFTSINDFGINFGVGLPISKRNPTNVNIGLEYGQRGTTDNNLLQENYFNLRISLSFNDLWFIKRRID